MANIATRRVFLKKAGQSLLTPLAGKFGFCAAPAFAQAEMGVGFAVIQMVSAISGMMSDRSDPTGKLLSINTQMLISISSQVAVVQRSMEQVLFRLSEIGAALKILPEAIVVEEFKGRISGAMSRYSEVIKTYHLDLNARGIDYASSQNKQEIQAIIADLREARSVLFGYNNEISLPIVAMCLQCEAYCMAMVGERDTRLLAALDAYFQWFSRWSEPNGPASLPLKIRADFDEFLAADKAMRDFAATTEGHGCVSKAQASLGGVCRFVREFEARVVRSKPEPSDTTARYRQGVMDLRAAGATIDNRLFELVPFDFFEVAEGADMLGQQCSLTTAGGGLVFGLGAEAARRWGADIAQCKLRRVVPEEVIALNKTHVAKVRLARDRVMMRNAFLVTTRNALTFCSRIRQEAKG